MTPGERLRDWINGLREWWGEALKTFLVNVISFGIEAFFDVLGKAMAPKFKPLIETLEKSGEVPKEIQPILDEIKSPTGQVGAIMASAAGYSIIGGAVGSVLDALFLRFAYSVNKMIHPRLLTEEQFIALWRRGEPLGDGIMDYLYQLGLDTESITGLMKLSEVRLDPVTIAELYRRDPEEYKKYLKDLHDTGWDSDRIKAFLELVNIIPPLADMVRFADFSSFDPDVIAKWRQFYDAPSWITEPMSLIGITNEPPRDWANKYWFSHWRQPGRYELGDMYRRALLGKPLIGTGDYGGEEQEGEAEDTIKLAYKTMGYSSFWQDALLQLVREIPTRVDVRRWWDMRTIDEAELRSIYQRQGYFGKDLDNYVKWTKVYVAFPDLLARWKNGWISEGDVRSELAALDMEPERIDEMMQTKIKQAQPERTEKERDLTKSEIVKGVKKEYITWEDGIDLLIDLGYDSTEADFILSIWVAVEAGSPETLPEFKALTQKWRQSVGKEAAPVPEELKAAANDVVRITKEIEALNKAIKEEEAGLIEGEVLPEAATERLDELRVTLHRAEASLGEARSRYDKQLAIFRHRWTA